MCWWVHHRKVSHWHLLTAHGNQSQKQYWWVLYPSLLHRFWLYFCDIQRKGKKNSTSLLLETKILKNNDNVQLLICIWQINKHKLDLLIILSSYNSYFRAVYYLKKMYYYYYLEIWGLSWRRGRNLWPLYWCINNLAHWDCSLYACPYLQAIQNLVWMKITCSDSSATIIWRSYFVTFLVCTLCTVMSKISL